MADEDAQTNGDSSLDLLQVRQTLLSNSTKQRVAELTNIHEALKREGRYCCRLYDQGLTSDSDPDLQRYPPRKYYRS
jgi:hypothetical protein